MRESLRLPHFDLSRDIAFPVDEFAEFQRRASLMTVRAIHALEAKSAALYGPDWHEARKLADEQQRQENERREQQIAEEQAAKRQAYEVSLLKAATPRYRLNGSGGANG